MSSRRLLVLSAALSTGVAFGAEAQFMAIRAGDVDGLGWGSGGGQLNACMGPVNNDGLGLLGPGDGLPDITGNGAVGSAPVGDNWDNRSTAEWQGVSVTGFGFSQAPLTTGSEYTDISLSSTYTSPPNPFPDPAGPGIPNDAIFIFDFHVDTGDIEETDALYLNAVIGDLDNGSPTATVTRADSSQVVLPLVLQQKLIAPCTDGLLQAVTVPLDFRDVFLDEPGGYRGQLAVVFDLPGEPYTAFDYAEISRLPAVVSCVEPPSNLVAWYPFDTSPPPQMYTFEIVAGLASELKNGAQPEPGGRIGGGLHLDGSGGYVEVSSNVAFDLDATGISFDAWLRIDPAEAGGPILARQTTGAGQIGYALAVAGASGSRELIVLIDDGVAQTSYILAGNAVIPDATWVHVAVVLEEGPSGGVQASFWVDGVATGSASGGSGSPAAAIADGLFTIGDYQTQTFEGWIDELEIYDGPLSTTAIAAIAAAGSDGKCRCAGIDGRLYAWWRAEGDLSDEMLASNDGTALIGAAGYAPGYIGQAFTFDGSTAAVRLGNIHPFDSDLAIDAWIRFTGTTPAAIEPLVDKRSSTGRGYFLYLANGQLTLSLQDDDVGPPQLVASGGPPIADGAWHHFAFEILRTAPLVGSLYLDGLPVADVDAAVLTGNLATSAQIQLGASYDPTPAYFQGQIDEVGFWTLPASVPERPFEDVVFDIARAATRGKCPAIQGIEIEQDESTGGVVRLTFSEAEVVANIIPGRNPAQVADDIVQAVLANSAAQAAGIWAYSTGARVIFVGGAASAISWTDAGLYLAHLDASQIATPPASVPALRGGPLVLLSLVLGAFGHAGLARAADPGVGLGRHPEA